MFKRILILPGCLLLVLNLGAQEQFRPATFVGIGAGVSLSRVGFDPVITQDILVSNSIGFILRHVSEPHIGLQTELNYTRRGWIESRDSVGKYKRELEVFDLPLMAVFVAGSKTLRLFASLGPYVSYLNHEKETISVADTNLYRSYYNRTLHNNWEFGLIVGLGIELHTKIGAFGARALYSNSLTNLFPLNVSDYYFRASRAQMLNVGITYFMRL
jgi:hypothetical protein